MKGYDHSYPRFQPSHHHSIITVRFLHSHHVYVLVRKNKSALLHDWLSQLDAVRADLKHSNGCFGQISEKESFTSHLTTSCYFRFSFWQRAQALKLIRIIPVLIVLWFNFYWPKFDLPNSQPNPDLKRDMLMKQSFLLCMLWFLQNHTSERN